VHLPTGARTRRRKSRRDAEAPPRRRILNRRGWGDRVDLMREGKTGGTGCGGGRGGGGEEGGRGVGDEERRRGHAGGRRRRGQDGILDS
jgi:hypothetical protein